MPPSDPKSKWFERLAVLPICLCVGMLLLHMIWVTPAAADHEAASQPLISVDAQNEPLGQVLEKITRDTSYTFIVEEQWRSHPVRIAFQNLPLDDGLKRILVNLNHVIVYESAHEIRIAIYGQIAPKSGGNYSSRPYEPPPVPIQQPERIQNQEPPTEEESTPASEASETREEGAEEGGKQEKNE
jgi:hypothetical protein